MATYCGDRQAGGEEGTHPVIVEVMHVDAAHQRDVTLLVRLVRHAALLRHLHPLLVRDLRIHLFVFLLAAGARRGHTLAGSPGGDVQREEGVELEDREVVLVADEEDEVRDVLCTGASASGRTAGVALDAARGWWGGGCSMSSHGWSTGYVTAPRTPPPSVA